MAVVDQVVKMIESLDLKPAHFAKRLGISDSRLSRIINSNGHVRSDFIDLIQEKFPNINLNWLFTGEGPMWLGEEEPESVSMEVNGKNQVYLISNIKASGGELSEPLADYEATVLNIPGLPKGAVCFEVLGSSMSPVIEEGDIVVGVPMEKGEAIHRDRPYIVSTRMDGETVKYVEIDYDNEVAKLIPANKQVMNPTTIGLDSIVRMYEVRKVLKNV